MFIWRVNNECNREFVNEAFGCTLASRRRRIFADLNPKPPAHWFYRDFLDHQDRLLAEGANPGYNCAHFTIADNLSVSDEQLHEALRSYDRGSVWYQRDILGRRTGASGRIYAAYRCEEVSVTREWVEARKYQELSLGIDVGARVPPPWRCASSPRAGASAWLPTASGTGRAGRTRWTRPPTRRW